MGVTIVKLADASWSSGIGATIQVGSSGPGAGFHHCVRDLTVDSNFGAQPGASYSNGIAGVGHSFLVENVELINLGSRSGEAFGIFIGNFARDRRDPAVPCDHPQLQGPQALAGQQRGFFRHHSHRQQSSGAA